MTCASGADMVRGGVESSWFVGEHRVVGIGSSSQNKMPPARPSRSRMARNRAPNLVYSQLFPHHKRRSDEAHAGTIAWGKEGSKKWLQLLNDHWIGPANQYLCGNEITIADYFGACMVTIGDLVGCDLSAYPNVQRWLANMKKLKNWDTINEVFTGFATANKGKEFVRLP
jgi:glutathione S-transferase